MRWHGRRRYPWPGFAPVGHALHDARWLDRLAAGFFAMLAFLYVISWGWVVKDSLDSMNAHAAGRPGMVAIAHCEDNGIGLDLRRSWSCEGDFAATDGTFRIDSVLLRVHDDDRPLGLLPARVSGPKMDTAWAEGDVEWAAALVLTAALPVVVWFLLRWALEVIEPARGWPNRSRRRPADV